jgi:hypothetical protein
MLLCYSCANYLILILGMKLVACPIASHSESHLCMKLIESTLIVILTAPPVLDETGMATINSYFMFVEVILCYLYILLDECWNYFEAKEQIFCYSRKRHF